LAFLAGFYATDLVLPAPKGMPDPGFDEVNRFDGQQAAKSKLSQVR